ncbi:hypothetical protein M409DRAFT_18395 [Zasmidium cellare ATCC 36951]|uniref:Phosphatidylglycerol/phosphatidylinositol transfer protein n=1 Tax=Zasmidium cellare ATCC 36951 TaxID=1080233 RepID=A0A6A6CZN9_ZASCE|nr:uncharacterized protein M409DRAFT_18395 [Zasmidium cellare ATCC 36951]KAF2171279.1 hypothetical protein M409DRAFT_18395 [Zasmidium cellare ATCC 36951]
MKFLSLIALAASITAVASSAISGNARIEHCKDYGNDDALQLSEVNIEPSPAIRGQPIRLTAKGLSNTIINPGATMEIKVHKGVFKKTYTQQLCGGENGLDCPTNHVDFSFEEVIPKRTPHGDWKVDVKVRDGKTELACLKGKLRIEKK